MSSSQKPRLATPTRKKPKVASSNALSSSSSTSTIATTMSLQQGATSNAASSNAGIMRNDSTSNSATGLEKTASTTLTCSSVSDGKNDDDDNYVYNLEDLDEDQKKKHQDIENRIKEAIANEHWLTSRKVYENWCFFSNLYTLNKAQQDENVTIIRRFMIQARNLRLGKPTVNKKIFSAPNYLDKKLVQGRFTFLSNKDNPHKLEDLFKLTETTSREELIRKFHDNKDEVGGNYITQCYLYNKYCYGEAFVHEFPELGLIPYNNKYIFTSDKTLRKQSKECRMLMPYADENILHMVIARRQIVHVHYLLDLYENLHKEGTLKHGLATLLSARTTGTFFSKSEKKFYFGSLPLHFAACANNTHVFDLVLDYALRCEHSNSNQRRCLGFNAIFARSECGDTILHLCVLHNLQNMYAHIVQKAEKIVEAEVERLYEKAKSSHANYITINDFVNDELEAYKGQREECPYPLPKVQQIQIPPALLLAKDVSYIGWKNFVVEKILNDRFYHALNDEYLSPLTLAASNFSDEGEANSNNRIDQMNNDILNKLEEVHASVMQVGQPQMHEYEITMMEFMTTNKSKAAYAGNNPYFSLWEFGQLSCKRITLEGLDISYNPHRYGHKSADVKEECKSAISILCENSDKPEGLQKGAPMIKDIIEMKWKVFGNPTFLSNFKATVGLCLSLGIIAVYFDSDYNSWDDLLSLNCIDFWECFWKLFVRLLVTFSYILSVYLIVHYYWLSAGDKTFWQNFWENIKWTNLFTDRHYRSVALFEKGCRYITMMSFFMFIIFRLFLTFDRMLPESSTGAFVPIETVVSSAINYNATHISLILDKATLPSFNTISNSSNDIISYINILTNPLTCWGFLEKFFLVTCVVMVYINLFFSFICFESVGPIVIIMFRVISNNIPNFIKFYLFLTVAFSLVASVVSPADLSKRGFSFFLDLFSLMIKASFDVSLFANDDGDNWKNLKLAISGTPDTPASGIIDATLPNTFLLEAINLLFTVTIKLVMLNLLIAMVNDTYADCSKKKDEIILMEQYNIMDGLEYRLTVKEINRNVRTLFALPITISPFEEEDNKRELKNTSYGFEYHELQKDWQKSGVKDSKGARPKYVIETPIFTRTPSQHKESHKFAKMFGFGEGPTDCLDAIKSSPRADHEYNKLSEADRRAVDEIIRQRHETIHQERYMVIQALHKAASSSIGSSPEDQDPSLRRPSSSTSESSRKSRSK